MSFLAKNFLSWVQETFNNREIATALWFLLIFGFCLRSNAVRKSLGGLLNALFNKRLLLLFGSFFVNIVGICWILIYLNLWRTDQLVSTILWFFLSSYSLLDRATCDDIEKINIRSLCVDHLRALVVFEFLVVAYTFSLWLEFIVVPLLSILVIPIVYSEYKPEYYTLSTICQRIVMVIVLLMLWNSLKSIVVDSQSFFSTNTGRDFLLPFFLSLGSMPFLYISHCYSVLERAYLRIDLKQFQPDQIKRYAKRRFCYAFFLRPKLLRLAIHRFHSIPAMTTSDVDQIIFDLRSHQHDGSGQE